MTSPKSDNLKPTNISDASIAVYQALYNYGPGDQRHIMHVVPPHYIPTQQDLVACLSDLIQRGIVKKTELDHYELLNIDRGPYAGGNGY